MTADAMAARVLWAVLAAGYCAAVAADNAAGWAVFGVLWWIGDFILEHV